MADKRIIELDATSELDSFDFLPIDNSKLASEENSGTRKIRVSTLLETTVKVMLTQTEYDDLPSDKLTDGKVYYITDESKIIINGTVYGAGGETVSDVYVNGTSVVDANAIAQIKSYKEVTQAEYDALPDTKQTDGVMYCIKDSDFSAENVPYDNSDSHAQSTDVQGALDEAFERTVDLANGLTSAFNDVAENYTSAQHNYTKGDYVLYETKLYRCISDTSGAWDSTKWEEVKVTDELHELDENKADTDGFYDELFAGNLVTDMHTADNTAYLYRQSPSASSVSQNIVGGTVAWNQLVQNGDFATTTRWDYSSNTFSVANNIGTFTAQSQGQQVTQVVPYILNHKYLGIMQIKTTTATESVWLRFYGQNKVHTPATTNWQTVATIVNSIVDSTNSFGVRDDRTSSWDAIQIKNANLFDLTQAFGSTIADYVYTLEQATAGSGIAWLKANGFLTKDYYPYDVGSLQSVKTSGRKIVGKNIASVNSVTAGSGNIDIYNGIGIQSNITISFKCNNFSFTNAGASLVVIIDSDNQAHPITPSGFGLSANTVYNNRVSATYNLNYKFIRLFIPTTGYTNISGSLDDIQIELGSTTTDYEPYKSKTYPFDSDLTLRGIPKLDSNNNLYYDGDVYNADGTVDRNWKEQKLQNVVISSDAVNANGYIRFILGFTDKKYGTTNVKSNICITSSTPVGADADSELISGYGSNTNLYFTIKASRLSGDLSTASNRQTALNTWLSQNDFTVMYELATPTSETADAYENPQLVGSTEEFIDTRDVPIPVGGERKYYTDLKAKLEELAKIPDVPTTNGTYTLKATRSASGVVYSWVSG